MSVTATGPISLPLENLRILLASCAAFQTWTDSADETEAREHIYLVDLPAPATGNEYTADELSGFRPCAIIDIYDLVGRPGLGSFSSTRVAESAYQDGGKLTLTFEADVPDEHADAADDAKLDFMNKVGGVMTDMLSLAGQNGMLSIQKIEMFIPPQRIDQTQSVTQGDRYKTVLLIEHGI